MTPTRFDLKPMLAAHSMEPGPDSDFPHHGAMGNTKLGSFASVFEYIDTCNMTCFEAVDPKCIGNTQSSTKNKRILLAQK